MNDPETDRTVDGMVRRSLERALEAASEAPLREAAELLLEAIRAEPDIAALLEAGQLDELAAAIGHATGRESSEDLPAQNSQPAEQSG
jgi:hypothetical protein